MTIVLIFAVPISFIKKQLPGGVFYKKGVLRNFTNFTGKHRCQSLFFNKVAGLRPATLSKKRFWHRCFPVKFAKFLRTPFLQTLLGDCLWKPVKGNVSFIFDWLFNFGLYFSKKRLCHVMKSHIKTKKSSQIFKNKRMFIYIETFFSWKSLSFNIRFSFLLLQNKTEAYKDRQMWL